MTVVALSPLCPFSGVSLCLEDVQRTLTNKGGPRILLGTVECFQVSLYLLPSLLCIILIWLKRAGN